MSYTELVKLRVHNLGHTAPSLAISAGDNIKAVQRMLELSRRRWQSLNLRGSGYETDCGWFADQGKPVTHLS